MTLNSHGLVIAPGFCSLFFFLLLKKIPSSMKNGGSATGYVMSVTTHCLKQSHHICNIIIIISGFCFFCVQHQKRLKGNKNWEQKKGLKLSFHQTGLYSYYTVIRSKPHAYSDTYTHTCIITIPNLCICMECYCILNSNWDPWIFPLHILCPGHRPIIKGISRGILPPKTMFYCNSIALVLSRRSDYP